MEMRTMIKTSRRMPPMMPPTSAPMLRDESWEQVAEEQELHPSSNEAEEQERQELHEPLSIEDERG
jgi:hypothetical protein